MGAWMALPTACAKGIGSMRGGRVDRMRSARGVTVLELVVVLGVLALVAALSVTVLGELWRASTLQSVARRLYGDLAYARATALQTGRRVLVCPVRGEEGCVTGASWTAGWQVRILAPACIHGNGAGGCAARTERVAPAIPAFVRIDGNRPLQAYVGYDPDGVSRLHSGAFQAGTFTVCRSDREGVAVRIVINAAGRPRWETVASLRCAG